MVPLRRSRSGLIVSLLGLALAVGVQVVAALPGPPLYDGVVTVDPYRYLEPTGSEPGGAQGQSNSGPTSGDTSPAVAIGTPEQPPQAQLIAGAGALAIPPGTTTLTVSIEPVPPGIAPSPESIIGNVYRFTIVNQAGAPVTGLADKQVTIALRDAGSTGIVQIAQLVNGTWTPQPTVSAAVNGTYETTGVTTLGDFALLGVAASVGSSGSAISPFALVTGAVITAAVLAGMATVVLKRVDRSA